MNRANLSVFFAALLMLAAGKGWAKEGDLVRFSTAPQDDREYVGSVSAAMNPIGHIQAWDNSISVSTKTEEPRPVCGSTQTVLETDESLWLYGASDWGKWAYTMSALYRLEYPESAFIECGDSRFEQNYWRKFKKVPYEIMEWLNIPGTKVRLGLKKDHSTVWELNDEVEPIFKSGMRLNRRGSMQEPGIDLERFHNVISTAGPYQQ